MKHVISLSVVLFCSAALAPAGAETPDQATRVMPHGKKPNDARLADLKDLNGYFPMHVPHSAAAWRERADQVRRRILVASGLWPMPPRPPVHATIHGRVDRDDYTVERVYFESHPGFYVTGSLYRPKGQPGPLPVVLSPHGHFSNGRFHDHGEDETLNQIHHGAERFIVGGRHPLQARCVHLARMGCIVFHYDMIGYADSLQLSQALAHGHRERRPEMEGPADWGLFSAQAEMRLQNVFGLQTFNSLRAIDFVVGLDDVDTSRIGVTGASGGGTQTMILAALDPRIAVAFPAVMVSTAMQGGCPCENACCLRVGTGNIEFAALFAPKPQGLTAADDWTRELATKGLPELKQLYKLLGAESLLEGYTRLVYFPHNFNHVSRTKMYAWMNEHLRLRQGRILEADYVPLTIEEMTVWNDAHPRPPSGEGFERTLLRQLSDASDRQLEELSASSGDYRKLVTAALETILATSWDGIGEVQRTKVTKTDAGNYWIFKDLIRTDTTELPLIFLHPKGWNNEVVVWASGSGKASLLDAAGQPRAEVVQLLDRGYSIVSADLFQQGEFLDGQPMTETRRVSSNDRDFAGYTYGYNRTLMGHQVHDLLTLLKFIAEDEHPTEKVHLMGVEGAGPHAVLATALAGQRVARLAIDSGHFKFASITSWRDPNFLPGAIKYGDLPGMLRLCGPEPIWVGAKPSERDGAQPIGTLGAFREGAAANLVLQESTHPVASAVDWLSN